MAKYERYSAKALSGEFGVSKQKKTNFVEVIFEVVDGEGKGRKFPYQGYFTEATQERTIQSLRLCGCTFPGDDVTNLAGITTNVVEVQVEDSDFGKKVAWVNEAGRGAISDENTLDKSSKKALAGAMKGMLLTLKGGGAAKPKAPPLGADPFAVKPGDVANETTSDGDPTYGEAAGGATGTDNDIPF